MPSNASATWSQKLLLWPDTTTVLRHLKSSRSGVGVRSGWECALAKVRRSVIASGGAAAIVAAERELKILARCRRGVAAKPEWEPAFAFHAEGFDLNGGWGPSMLRLLDFCAKSAADITGEPPARFRLRAMQIVSHVLSATNAALIRARMFIPFSLSLLHPV